MKDDLSAVKNNSMIRSKKLRREKFFILDFYENRLDGQDWSGISAVKNRRVYKIPAGLYRWAPPNSFEKPLYMKWTAAIV